MLLKANKQIEKVANEKSRIEQRLSDMELDKNVL